MTPVEVLFGFTDFTKFKEAVLKFKKGFTENPDAIGTVDPEMEQRYKDEKG